MYARLNYCFGAQNVRSQNGTISDFEQFLMHYIHYIQHILNRAKTVFLSHKKRNFVLSSYLFNEIWPEVNLLDPWKIDPEDPFDLPQPVVVGLDDGHVGAVLDVVQGLDQVEAQLQGLEAREGVQRNVCKFSWIEQISC